MSNSNQASKVRKSGCYWVKTKPVYEGQPEQEQWRIMEWDSSANVGGGVWSIFGCEHIFYEDSALVEIDETLLEREPNKASNDFHSGLAIAIQSIRMWGHDQIIEEILHGLGSGVDEFCAYLESEGGVDGETLDYLVEHELVTWTTK